MIDITFTEPEDLTDYICTQVDQGKLKNIALLSKAFSKESYALDWFVERENGARYISAWKLIIWNNCARMHLIADESSDRLSLLFDCIIISELKDYEVTFISKLRNQLVSSTSKIIALEQKTIDKNSIKC